MKPKPYILLIILLGWGLYLLLQNFCLEPVQIKQLFFWLGHFFLLFILTLISISLGELLLEKLKIPALTQIERKTLGAGLGFSSLGFIVFFLGALKLYYFFTGFILAGVLFLLLWPRIKNIFRETIMAEILSAPMKHQYTLPGSRSGRLIFIGIVITLLIILLSVLIPPLDYDDLEYHLGVPAQYISSHGISYLPNNMYSNFPLHMEMLYTLGLLLNGPILAKMLHFLFLILTLIVVVVLGNKLSPSRGLLPALIFVNIPIVAITSAKAYNDLGLTFFGLASIYSLWRWGEGKDKKFLILAGLFSGSALAAKYTALIFFLIPFAAFIFIFSLKEKRGIRHALAMPAMFAVISLFVASPWFIKNLAYTGNPVFPIAYGQLGGKNWGEFEAMRFKKQHRVGLSDFKNVMEAPKKIISGRELNLGITLVLFIPFLFFIKSPPPAVKRFGMYIIFYFFVWSFFTHRMPRFLIPALPLLSILAGYSIFYFLNLRKYLGRAMAVFLIAGFIFNSAYLFYQTALIHPLQFITGKDTEKEYLSKIFYLYPTMDFINTCLPQDSKILFIAEARTFYCEKAFLANTPLDKNIIVEISNRSKDAEDILDKLKNMGVTHILYNVTEVRRITQSYQSFNWATPKAQEKYLDFMEKYLKIIFSEEGVAVAEIRKGR